MVNTDTILRWNTRNIAAIDEIDSSTTSSNLLGGTIEVKGHQHKKQMKAFQSLTKDFFSRNKGLVTIKHPYPVSAEWVAEVYITSIIVYNMVFKNIRPITIRFAFIGEAQFKYN